MSFESVLDAVAEFLKARKRVTYGLLQREFHLDPAALSDVKNELILGRRVAFDEDGVVLVWRPPVEETPAERRQLTVMFCDLVGSTKLSSRLDPEDLRDIVRSYHDECAAVLRPLGGHVAQFLGDGILTYFGYPVTNEDDAERAVQAGLSIVQTVLRLSNRLGPRVAGGLAVRVGIHTGLVVVGGLGDARNPSRLALGEAPNLAAHIQGVAEPNTVLVSQATLDLLPLRFIIDDLGPVVLKDPANPVRLARVVGQLDAGNRRAARPELEDPAGHLGTLQDAWKTVCGGKGFSVSLVGEAGLGKTRLADELCAHVEANGGSVQVLRCSAFHRQSALHPVARQLLLRAGLNPDAPGDDVLPRLDAVLKADGIDCPDTESLLAALTGPGFTTAAGAPEMAPTVLMRSLQTLLLDWLRAAARERAALMVWEDVHWADPSTLAVLKLLLEGPPRPGLLILMTARPDFLPPWDASATSATVTLDRMDGPHIRHLIQQVAANHALAPALVERIAGIAEGVPLYAEQITRSVVDSVVSTMSIEVPASLHASLMARLDRMGPAKSVAQTAALLGREFSTDLLGAVCEMSPGDMTRVLAHLTAGDILQAMPGSVPQRYTFRHALLQAEAGDSMLRSARQAVHRRIAEVLQERFATTVEVEPETLARHLTGAGQIRPAIVEWRHAGEHALARSAVREALSHLQEGMNLLPGLEPGLDRNALELTLQIPRASALRALQGVGAPATGAAYERASALARQLGDQRRLIPALNGLYAYHLVSAQYAGALDSAQSLLDVARANGDGMFEMIGLRAVGAVAFHVGDPATAAVHLERSLALYEPERHASIATQLGIDHKVMTSNFLALTRLVQGQVDAALEVQRQGLAWADRIDHAHSIAQALVFYCLLLAVHEDWANVPPLAERTIEVGVKRGFPVMESGGRFFLGAARAFDGDLEGGLKTMRESSVQWWASGIRNYRPFSELLLARAHAMCGDIDAARTFLDAARSGIEATSERWIEAEMWRVRGELLSETCEADLRRALAVARAQKATAFEQRALRSLAARGFA